MKRFLILTTAALSFFACSDSSSPSNMTSADGATPAPAASGCASISCNVASENLCDDYTMATATQCADVPGACSKRGGTLAKPAACPMAGFKAKCTMPGPGGYVLRFYGARGESADQNFCTGIAMGTWSTTY